jgi:hypothetical protein
MNIRRNPLPRFAVAAALALSAPLALAQARVVPTDPVQYERVSLRQTVDSCTFAEDRVLVRSEAGRIVVVQPQNACLVPGPPEVVDIQLGAFPPGEYEVEILPAEGQPAVERVTFRVSGLAQPAVVPAPPYPLADYSGIWWTPGEGGWGLSLHQGRMYTLFGSIYVFDAQQQPMWFTVTSGQWLSSTRWEGALFHSEGPEWSVQRYDSSNVQHRVAGSIALDFSMTPGNEDKATLTYTLDGVTVTKTISRIRL